MKWLDFIDDKVYWSCFSAILAWKIGEGIAALIELLFLKPKR